MPERLRTAEAVLDLLEARVSEWRPGQDADGLHAQFDIAAAAVNVLDDAHRPFYAERLQRLAERVGIVIAPPMGPRELRKIAILRTESLRGDLERALTHIDPPVEVRPTSEANTFTLWCQPAAAAHPFENQTALVYEIDASLRSAFDLGEVGQFVLLPQD